MANSYFFAPNTSQSPPPPILYSGTGTVDWTNPTSLPAIVVSIPNVFGTSAPSSFNVPPFEFTAGTDSYSITVQSGTGGAWDFSACANGVQFRPALATAFVQMLVQLEPSVITTGIGPSSMSVIRQLVAAAMPLTFAETLFYRYSYMYTGAQQTPPSPGSWVDLVPGMRLRVDSEAYQMINPNGQTGLNGFVANGTTKIEISSSAGNPSETALNPFLSEAAPVVEPSASGAGGSVDVMNALNTGGIFSPQYFRLCYPPQGLKAASSLGWNGTQFNATIIVAPFCADIEAMTQAYMSTGLVPVGGTWFNGRCLLTPEISVYISGKQKWVPLGTTLRNVLEGLTAMPYFGLFGPNAAPTSISCSRSVPLQGGPSVGWSGPAWATITLSGDGGYQFYQYDQGVDSFDLPLLGGDVLTIELP